MNVKKTADAPKQEVTGASTLENELRAREGTALAMDAGLSYAGDKVRIIFRGVAGHERISLLVEGDRIKVEAD